MRIDRSKLKKSNSAITPECQSLIQKIIGCSDNAALSSELSKIKNLNFGKCELYHWADVLDICDGVLEEACRREDNSTWILHCDRDGSSMKPVLFQVLHFTSLLIEHSFTRHLYSSMEHLTTLLSSSDMAIVLAVLNLLYVFSKRSNFITRLAAEKKDLLLVRLTHLAESWGGKDNGFGLAECCQNLPMEEYPKSATTLHFEFYAEQKESKANKKAPASGLNSIHIETVDTLDQLPSEIMEDLCTRINVPKDKEMLLLTHIRLAHSFSNYEKRVQSVQARLQALSILVYSNAINDTVNSLLCNSFIEELVDVLELKDQKLVEIRSTSLRTLTSIIHLDRNPKLKHIIDVTGAASYHGFLPVLVRSCIQNMTDRESLSFPQQFSTALFSFLYHLASYEGGGEALVSCGLMESLLKVINWYSQGQEDITFVTRAVRVVDLITNLEMSAFQTHQGLSAFINRLEHEVSICRSQQPYVIKPRNSDSMSSVGSSALPAIENHDALSNDIALSPIMNHDANMETEVVTFTSPPQSPSNDLDECSTPSTAAATKVQCFPQRAALLKSMLNFMKKAIPDPAFSDSIRHLMDGSLPKSLKHIISNAEYYGASLFLLATDLVTVYVFQEPSLLSSLQDKGLTDVMLHALLVKDVPATREFLASLPNVFSALCLNNRGLQAFIQCKPFDCFFTVLLSPDYLPAMRRRRSSDPLGDTASNLGNAMDELMRHQPSLREDATKAIIKLLSEVCEMGRDQRYICQKASVKNEQPTSISLRSNPIVAENNNSSSDEDDEDELASTASNNSKQAENIETITSVQEKTPIPLIDYVLNVMKFVESILSNNTTDDHCREFVKQNGLDHLMSIYGLPNLPIDFPASQSCQAVHVVCKTILTLSHEPKVLEKGLSLLKDTLERLEPLHEYIDSPGSSVLLHELSNAPLSVTEPVLCAQATPLLHQVSATQGYITMLSHICKIGATSDIRTILVNQWGSENGLSVLKSLSRLYSSLVWESTVLLALCNEDIIPAESDFGLIDMEKLGQRCAKANETAEGGEKAEVEKTGGNLVRGTHEHGSNGVSRAMESLSTQDSSPMDVESEPSSQPPSQPPSQEAESTSEDDGDKKKYRGVMQMQAALIKPILTASSRLGRSLVELFGLLVKLCVGSSHRTRRNQLTPVAHLPPTKEARIIAAALTDLLATGYKWRAPPTSPVPKLQLTYYVCLVGFTGPMLFDEKKCPYYLMLQNFVSSGGQDSFLESFYWALSRGWTVPMEEGLEHPNVPAGTGEFLATWLMLAEKMVHTKNILESPHSIPTKTSSTHKPFNPVHYLVHIHKLIFEAIMYLWNKKPLKFYGAKMSESILIILCSILRGESVLREKLSKEKSAPLEPPAPEPQMPSLTNHTSSLSAAMSSLMPSLESFMEGAEAAGGRLSVANMLHAPLAASRAQEPAPINQQNLQQLMDMGFTRAHSIAALTNTSSLEQATEYILTHPAPPDDTPEVPSSTPAENSTPNPEPNTGGSNEGGVTDGDADGSGGAATDVPPASTSETAASGGSNDLDPSSADHGSMEMEVDEQQLIRAIAMSLGEEVVVPPQPSTSAPSTSAQSTSEQPASELSTSEQSTSEQSTSEQSTSEQSTSEQSIVQMATQMAVRATSAVASDAQEPKSDAPKSEQPSTSTSSAGGAGAAQPVQMEPISSDPDVALDTEKRDKFTNNILPGLLSLLDLLPEAVHRVCDLINVITLRNGEKWRRNILNALTVEIKQQITTLCKAAAPMTKSDGRTLLEWANNLSTSEEAQKLASRLHLLSLLFEMMKVNAESGSELASVDILDALVQLVDVSQNCLTACKHADVATPKWLPVLLLVLDIYQKNALANKRKIALKNIIGRNHVWKWFDDRVGRWLTYSAGNNKTIDDAYHAGESVAEFTAARRRYIVRFNTMVQENKETSNRRPVMLAVPEDPPGLPAASSDAPTSSAPPTASDTPAPVPAIADASHDATPPSTTSSGASSLIGGLVRPPIFSGTPSAPPVLSSIAGGPPVLSSTPSTSAPTSATAPTPYAFARMHTSNLIRHVYRRGSPSSLEDSDNRANHLLDAVLNSEEPPQDMVEKELESVEGLNHEQITTIIRCSVSLIALPVNANTLHAVLRLCLRLTREHQYALLFTELGGARLLLNLTQSSGFQGFTSLASLILRHVLEEPATLKHTYEKVIRSACQGAGSSLCGVSHGSVGTKEFHYVLRVLTPAACRSPDLFVECAKSALQINLPPPAKRDDDETRLASPSTPQILKCVVNKLTMVPSMSPLVQQLVHHMLEALTVKTSYQLTEEMDIVDNVTLSEALRDAVQEVSQDITTSTPSSLFHSHPTPRIVVHAAQEGNPPAVTALASTSLEKTDGAPKKEDAEKKDADTKSTQDANRPLMPKSSIMRLLAEFVKSYTCCAQMIMMHTFTAGLSELITEDCTVLAFILDQLLPQCQVVGDKDSPPLARVLIASLAACNHSPEAQTLLVGEIKSALNRAFVLPESSEKHTRIQALMGIINTIIEACPSPGHAHNTIFKTQTPTNMNNIVKILLKKGLVTDLARIAYNMDLASPNMAATVNSALKPLEILSRVVNQSQNVTSKSGGGKNKQTNNMTDGATENNTPLDSEEVVNVDNDMTMDDVGGNTEANAAEDSAPNTDAPPESERANPDSELPTTRLENVLQRLMRADTDNEDQVLGEIVTDNSDPRSVIISVATAGDDIEDDDNADRSHDDDFYNSQMISHMSDDDNSNHDDSDNDSDSDSDDDDDDDGEDDDDDDDDDDDESSNSCDDSSYDEQNRQANDNQDDEEIIDDDEEGSDMEADNDDYDEMDEAMYAMNDNNIDFDMFPSGLEILLDDRRFRGLNGGAQDVENGNEASAASLPPAPSTVTQNHPLLIRGSDTHQIGTSLAARVHRSVRPRGTYRYNPSTQTLQLQSVSRINPTALLQRLLDDDVLQITNSLNPTNPSARVHFDSLCPDNNATGSGVLSGVPSVLSRWTEESHVLDSETTHDCVTILKPEIMKELEKHRDEELKVRKEKRLKEAEEEKKKQEAEKAAENKKNDKSETTAVIESIVDEVIISTVNEDAPAMSVETPASTAASNPASSSASVTSTGGVIVTPRVAWGAPPPTTHTPAQSMEVEVRTSPGHPPTTGGTTEPTPIDLSMSATSTPNPQMSESAAEALVSLYPAVSDDSPRGGVSRPGGAPPAAVSLGNITLSALIEGIPNLDNDQSGSSRAPPAAPSVAWPEPSAMQTTGTTAPPASSVPQDPELLTTMAPGTTEESTGPEEPPSVTPSAPEMAGTMASATDPPPTDSSSQNNTGAEASGSASAAAPAITPENLSNVTSSDAVTINSSEPSSQEASTSDGGTPGEPSEPTAAPPNTGSSTDPAGGSSSGGGGSGSSAVLDGVDPSFLAALPDSIRQEVIADQLRLYQIQQQAQRQQEQAEALGVPEVSSEFLAALPAHIQEEVLSQQAEQARIANQSSSDTTPAEGTTDAPVDAGSFITSLSTPLRQQVLADMDDSMVAVLPTHMAMEAQSLRREREENHRMLVHERLLAQGSLSRFNASRYTLSGVRGSGMPWSFMNSTRTADHSNNSSVRLKGRHLLDQETLTCLLVLLFVDEPKLNTTRLHRIFRNLCYHNTTRAWIIKSLLAILQKTNDGHEMDVKCVSTSRRKSSGHVSNGVECGAVERGAAEQGEDAVMVSDSRTVIECTSNKTTNSHTPTWLAMSIDAALGCRTHVFQLHRQTGRKHNSTSGAALTVHPQASPIICRHVLDTLIVLAKQFPAQFLPEAGKTEGKTDQKGADKCATAVECGGKPLLSTPLKTSTPASTPNAANTPTSAAKSSASRSEQEFWETLVRLDSVIGSKKMKTLQRQHNATAQDVSQGYSTFESAPIGQLMSMLHHPVVKRSQLLTDRLLRLLGLVSIGLPDANARNNAEQSNVVSRQSSVTDEVPIIAELNTGARSSATPQTRRVTSAAPAVPSAMSTASPMSALMSTPAATLASEAGLFTPNIESINVTVPLSTDTPNGHAPAGGATSTPKSSSADHLKKQKDAKTLSTNKPVLENQLQLAVNVLISKSCSEEGLEDATDLLLQLSQANSATRTMILNMLLEGAHQLAHTVCTHIRQLLSELDELNNVNKCADLEMSDDNLSGPSMQRKGLLTNRYQKGEMIVLHSSGNVRGSGRELQLPAMSLLTSKMSSQQFLLRVLKVIIQLRTASKQANVLESSKNAAGFTRRPDLEMMSEIESMMGLPSTSNEQANQPDPAPASASTAQPSRAVEESGSTAEGSAPAGPSDSGNDNAPMEVDAEPSKPSTSAATSGSEQKDTRKPLCHQMRLSEQLVLEDLWETLSRCLVQLANTSDHHAVLVLQPAVEAFFLIHSGEKDKSSADQHSTHREDQTSHLNIDLRSPASPASPLPAAGTTLTRENSVMSGVMATMSADMQKFLSFAEQHRTVLNQILRQSTTPLADGTFCVLVHHTRILDFDVKRRYFRQELDRLDDGVRREDLAVHVKRENVFEDSYRELHRRSADEWKHRFYIVFEGEEGQDAGGLLREWYLIIAREIFNPMYALFLTSPGERVTYTVNPLSQCNSNHLSYFKFVGRIIAKAIYDNKLLDCYFTRSFYKHILGVHVKYTDMESEDYSFYKGLVYLVEHHVDDLGYELTFSTEIQEFGVNEIRDLKPNGRNLAVTEANKLEYVQLVCQMRMTGAIRKQLGAFLEGFYDIIPKHLISIFNEQELELLLCGLPTIDIDDLKGNTEYHKYQITSLQIQWFWRALRSFDQAERACFLQFVTGTSKVPLQGFAHLEGMNGTQKFQIHRDDRSTDRLPSAHTCFNQLDLPAYETYDKLRRMVLLASIECQEGFGLA